jgi:hypothetical protein
MKDTILILEDDQGRLDRFAAAVGSIQPSFQIVSWRSAVRMAAEMERFLPAACLISLDHDLYPARGETEDPGDGLAIAKRLAELRPDCAVIIHSSNADRVRMMAGEFELAGMAFKVVLPLGADWVERYWLEAVRAMIAGRE